MKQKALSGVKVLDLTHYIAGPYCTKLLADYGAEVIKIERPGLGDGSRRVGPFYGDDPHPEKSGHFLYLNTNKLGVTLNMKSRTGIKIIKQLVKESDILVENFSPGVMERLGLDYDVLKKINPKIIMMSMPALGSSGPDKDYLAFGQTIDCLSGMDYRTGYEGEEPMLQSGLSYGDPLSGMNAAFACLSGLRHRNRTGQGMHMELSQVEGLIAFNADAVMDYTMNGRVQERMGNRHPSMTPHNCYPCRGENQWVTIAIPSDAAWKRFCEAIENPSLSEDSRFSDPLSRVDNRKELDDIIGEWTLKRDHYKVMQILQDADVPAGPVLNAKELLEDPHLNERGIFETVDHPVAGPHPYVGMYAKLSKTPGSIRKAAPCLGEDNGYVLGELLGVSEEEIDQLEKDGIIGTDPVGGVRSRQ